MTSHKDLEVWQAALELAVDVYGVTESFPREKIYDMTSQTRRSAVSIPSNIAEGAARQGDKEFYQDSRPFPLRRSRRQIDLAGASQHHGGLGTRYIQLEAGNESIRNPLSRSLHQVTSVRCSTNLTHKIQDPPVIGGLKLAVKKQRDAKR